MEAKQFRRSEKKQILTVKWKMRWKNYLLFLLHTFWLYCLLYYWRFPLLCIKRDAPCQLQINCHFDSLNFPNVSSLLHIRTILVHWPLLEISGPQKWVAGATLGGCYPPRPSASVENTLLDLLNSSYPTQPHSLIAKNWNRTKRIS